MEIEKVWRFVLDFDEKEYLIFNRGEKSSRHPFERLLTYHSNLHRWFVESIDTPFLSADSIYEVILDKEIAVLETFKEFIKWCDMVI